MKDCKKIELVFENCEVLDITNAVGDFIIDDIHSSVSRIACNSIAKMDSANLVAMEIYGDGEFNKENNFFNNKSHINRIADYKDITSIITYYDDTCETFYAKWSDNEYENDYQTTKIVNDNLYVVISDKETADTIYDKETLSELKDVKEFYIKEHVAAKNSLIKNGWEITWYDENTFQARKNHIIVCLSKSQVTIDNLATKEKFTYTNFVFRDICEIIADTLVFHNGYDPTEYDFARCGEQSEKIDESGNKYCAIKIENAELHYIKDKSLEPYTGELIINGNTNILSEDIYNFMWLHFLYLDDEFWDNY